MNVTKIIQKLMSINEEIKGINEDIALGEVEEIHLNTLSDTLSKTSFYHSSKITVKELDVLKRLVSEWPKDKIFPVIDLLRLVAMHPDGLKNLILRDYLPTIIKNAGDTSGDAHAANIMLLYRFIANCFSNIAVQKELLSYLDIVCCTIPTNIR